MVDSSSSSSPSSRSGSSSPSSSSPSSSLMPSQTELDEAVDVDAVREGLGLLEAEARGQQLSTPVSRPALEFSKLKEIRFFITGEPNLFFL